MLHSILTDPWALTLLISGMVIWISGFVIVFRSSKFQPKWVWFVVNCVAFTFYGLDAPPGVSVTLGVPIGSYYVFWFWWFGKKSPFDRWFKKDETNKP